MLDEIANINKAEGKRTPAWVVQTANGFPEESDRQKKQRERKRWKPLGG